jgi:hypothetical protein
MQLSPLALGLAGLVVLIVLVALLVLRARNGRRRHAISSAGRGPNNLHFVCAGCGGQFTHTKRTVAAWEKGTRRFFCNSCHKSWRQAQPIPPAQPAQPPHPEPTARPAGLTKQARMPSRGYSHPTPQVSTGPRRSGCLTVLVVLVVVPVTVYVVTRYA